MPFRIPRSFPRRHGLEAALLLGLLAWLTGNLAIMPDRARRERQRMVLQERGHACRSALLERLKAAETRALTLGHWLADGTLSAADPGASLRILNPWFAHSPSFSFTLLHQVNGHDLAFGRFTEGETRSLELQNQDGTPRSRPLTLDRQGSLHAGPWRDSSYDPTRRPWTAMAESLRSPSWGGPFVYQGLYATSAPCVSFIAPVRPPSGPYTGAAVVDVLLQELATLTEEHCPDPWISVLLSDERGRVLVIPRNLTQHFRQLLAAGQIPTLSAAHLRPFHLLHQETPRPSREGIFQSVSLPSGTGQAWSCSLPTLPGVQWRLDLLGSPKQAPPGPLGPLAGPALTLVIVGLLVALRARAWLQED